ncbi:hypothetical protein SAMN05216338_100856 [Bradyrhizobium sp. Rc2d]|nr:hypothetical protein SAMN05216338_100856 [Bradyrhizobium sp. Rc2d]
MSANYLRTIERLVLGGLISRPIGSVDQPIAVFAREPGLKHIAPDAFTDRQATSDEAAAFLDTQPRSPQLTTRVNSKETNRQERKQPKEGENNVRYVATS